jgi:hypothetical protein
MDRSRNRAGLRANISARDAGAQGRSAGRGKNLQGRLFGLVDAPTLNRCIAMPQKLDALAVEKCDVLSLDFSSLSCHNERGVWRRVRSPASQCG